MIGYVSFVIGQLEGVSLWFGVLGLVLLFLSSIFLLTVNMPKDYISICVNFREHKEYFEKSDSDLLLQLISDAQHAFTENSKIVRRKAARYTWAIWSLIFSLVFLIVSYVLHIL